MLMGNLGRNTETMGHNQMQILEMENIQAKVKNAFDGLTSRLDKYEKVRKHQAE